MIDFPNAKPRARKKPRDRLILSLSGGGFRGLFTALIVEKLSKQVGWTVFQNNIDLYAGTSVGGLISCGLCVGTHPTTIRKAIKDSGPQIFDRRIFGSNRFLKKPSSLFYRAFTPMYSEKPLEAAITKVLGDSSTKKLKQINSKLIVPAVCATTQEPKIFRSAGLIGDTADDITLADVARATSAAPTYFKPKAIGKTMIVDGGLIANAPELLAVTELMKKTKLSADRIKILSIGTASPSQAELLKGGGPSGIMSWLNAGLFELTLASQEKLIVKQCESLFAEKYIRIDNPPAPKDARKLSLDRADETSISILENLAEKAWENHTGADWIDKLFPQPVNE